VEIISLSGEQVPCQRLYQKVKAARLEFRQGYLRLVLPFGGTDGQELIRRHTPWILKQVRRYRQLVEESSSLTLLPRDRQQWETLMAGLIHQWSEQLRVKPTRIKWRWMRSTWGSCTSSGQVTFNQRLQFLPEVLVSYLVCHELAHLRFRGHGRAFRSLMNRYFPEIRQLRHQLCLYQFFLDRRYLT